MCSSNPFSGCLYPISGFPIFTSSLQTLSTIKKVRLDYLISFEHVTVRYIHTLVCTCTLNKRCKSQENEISTCFIEYNISFGNRKIQIKHSEACFKCAYINMVLSIM